LAVLVSWFTGNWNFTGRALARVEGRPAIRIAALAFVVPGWSSGNRFRGGPTPLSVWYADNPRNVAAFERQMRRKVHYVI